MRQNLQRARGKWGQLAKILGREGADRKKVGRFYVTVVKSVLLFGSETWVLTSWLEKSIAPQKSARQEVLVTSIQSLSALFMPMIDSLRFQKAPAIRNHLTP